MTLGWLLGWYCGLPNESRRPTDCRSKYPSGSPAVDAAKPPGIAIHRPGCICRKAAGDFPSTAGRLSYFYLFPSIVASCRFWKFWCGRVATGVPIQKLRAADLQAAYAAMGGRGLPIKPGCICTM